jgi:antibiotic biosynthesis monooxygenase (ABM) superfamily enzyme
MSLLYIAIYNFGLPVSAIALGIAVISFSLAAHYAWISRPAGASLRRNLIQVFVIFGITSLVLGLVSLFIPLSGRIDLPAAVLFLYSLLMFLFVYWVIKNQPSGS